MMNSRNMARVVSNELLFAEVASAIREGKSVVIKPKGCSMLPFIRGERDEVVLVSPDDIEIYDAVLAQLCTGVYVLHRVMEIREDSLVLMGDGNLQGKEQCRKEDVVAKVTEVIRDGHKHDCRAPRYRLMVRMWIRLMPVRRWILAIYKRLFV